jgi:hypothetical protein
MSRAVTLVLVILDELLFLFDLVVHRAHGERAGDFAGGVASHTVGNDEERELLVNEVIVLVVVSYFAYVGRGEKTDVLFEAHSRETLPGRAYLKRLGARTLKRQRRHRPLPRPR